VLKSLRQMWIDFNDSFTVALRDELQTKTEDRLRVQTNYENWSTFAKVIIERLPGCFYRASVYRPMLSALYAIAIPSVRPSVRHGVDQSKRLKVGSCNFHYSSPVPLVFA